MNIATMRTEIQYVYPNWAHVRRMPENQVVAVYRSLQKRGAFDGRVSRSGKELGYVVEPVKKPDPYHQITISEYVRGLDDE